jgi:hypothetical protein
LSVGFYMDEHVSAAITAGLRARGVDVLTVQEDGRKQLPDPQVLARGMELCRIVFTRDDDFLREATRLQRAGASFLGVIYAHQLGPSIGHCVQELELYALATDPVEWVSRVEYLK